MPNGQINPPARPPPAGHQGRPGPQPPPAPLKGINPNTIVQQAPSTTSTGAKVATGAAVAVGGVSLTLVVISAATGWGITKILDKGLDWIKGRKR